MTARTAAKLDPDTALGIGHHPLPLFLKTIPAPIIFTRRSVVKHQANLGIVRSSLKGFHKHVKRPQAELPPRGRLGG